MAIYQRGETFSHWIKIRDRNNDYVDPSTASITIKDPCGTTILSSASMNKSALGKWYYDYDTISSSATYGRYTVEVKLTSATGQVGMQHDEFYVMPWELAKDVRQITGASETKDISDDDLSDLCWKAYKEALKDIYYHHYFERPDCNPDTGTGFDGTNTSFQTKHFPIADVNGDGSITGNNTSCATDVDAWWIDEDGSYQRAVVVVDKYQNGEITITQNDGSTAIPDTEEGVYLDYYVSHESFDTDLFRNAVGHLAADMLVRRLKEIDRVTLGDLSPNIAILTEDSNRFYRKYRSLLGKVKKPAVGGV